MPTCPESNRSLSLARRLPVLALALLGLAACGGGGGSSPAMPLVLSMTDSTMLEGGGSMVFTVKVDAGSDLDKIVNYSTADLSANLASQPVVGYARGGAACTSGIDYVAASNVALRVPVGASSVTIAIPVCNDSVFQANKRFRLGITGASNAPVAYGLIVNDDAGGLNDTGIASCYNAAGSAVACPASGLAGQDAEYGRDAGSLTRGANGAGSFSYARLSASGQAMAAGASGWACARDAVTGLTWQVEPGVSQPGATAFADVQALVDAANSARLCGAADWRLPEVAELDGLVHAGRTAGVAASTDAFTDLAGLANQARAIYWSNTTYPDDAQSAWVVDFSIGTVGVRNKAASAGNTVSARLVSGAAVSGASSAEPCTAGSARAATDRYSAASDGTVTDKRTQLMWAQCPVGQSGSSCASGSPSGLGWSGALAQVASANASSYLGYSDWRLPNRNELASLVERRCRAPAINSAYFPNTAGASYWSNSPSVTSAGRAWYVDFVDGDVAIADLSGSRRLRLVRAGQ